MKDKVQNSFEEKVDFGNSLSLSGKDLFIYLFIYGCVGSSFLCKGFL